MTILSDLERLRVFRADPDETRRTLRLYAHDQHRARVRNAKIVAAKPKLRCGFCGRGSGEVKKLIQGPPPSVICNECVDVCRHLLDREAGKDKP